MEELITKKKTATILGISTASVNNWIRHGYLKSYNNNFNEREVFDLKKKIDIGEVNRLQKRANKTSSKNVFIPDEYVTKKEFSVKITEVTEYILKNKINIDQAIFLLAINLFIKTKDINFDVLDQLFLFNPDIFRRDGVYKHITSWLARLNYGRVDFNNDKVKYLLNFELPPEKDVLGLIYQSVTHEGDKSHLGSYYTPKNLVEELVNNNIKNHYKVLDPCCGTGQFILYFAKYIDKPHNIYGFDIDGRAVDIAKTNLLIHYVNIDFCPNIYNLDTLTLKRSDDLFNESSEFFDSFDFIATNPPWGAKYKESVISEIKNIFPDIISKESFSFFIQQSYRLLKSNGIMCFVLPEAVTNVKTHRDIRSFIINNLEILKIKYYGKIFKNVFSSVITVVMKKVSNNNKTMVCIENKTKVYNIEQNRFKRNTNKIIDIHVSPTDEIIINKLFEREYVTLKGNSDWALGVVTGDNKKYIKKTKISDEYEPIYKGSDLLPFILKTESNYIKFSPGNFQQVAPESKYRAPEKLIYKFISNKLVFAYDNKQHITLNSANILIPKISNYPIKIVLAMLNSSIINFYYKKKFNSVKILRGDIEQLPMPIFTEKEMNVIARIVDDIIADNTSIKELNNYLYKLLEFKNEEIKYIENYLN